MKKFEIGTRDTRRQGVIEIVRGVYIVIVSCSWEDKNRVLVNNVL